jgi:hypothetical protein
MGSDAQSHSEERGQECSVAILQRGMEAFLIIVFLEVSLMVYNYNHSCLGGEVGRLRSEPGPGKSMRSCGGYIYIYIYI